MRSALAVQAEELEAFYLSSSSGQKLAKARRELPIAPSVICGSDINWAERGAENGSFKPRLPSDCPQSPQLGHGRWRLRILMVSRGVVPIGRNSGGAELVAFSLSEQLVNSGEEVVLVSDIDTSMLKQVPAKLSITEVGTYKGLGRLVKLIPLDFPRWVFQHLLGNIRAAHRARSVLETDTNGFDIVHVHGALVAVLLSRLVRNSAGTSLLYTEHDSTPWSCHYRGRIERCIRRLIYRQLNLRACRSVTLVVTNFLPLSKELAARAEIPESRFAVVRNAAATDWSANRHYDESIKARYGFDRYLLFVGSLIERKGPDILLRALSQVTFPCILVGDGPMRTSLMRLASRAGISDRVVFTGALERHEICHYYADAEALVLPSVSEGVPLVVIEALSIGIPVIASNLEGVASVVRNRRNGLLVKPGDVTSLAEALTEIDRDKEMREFLANGARGSHQILQTWSDVVDQLRVLYAEKRLDCGVVLGRAEDNIITTEAHPIAPADRPYGPPSRIATSQPEHTAHA